MLSPNIRMKLKIYVNQPLFLLKTVRAIIIFAIFAMT